MQCALVAHAVTIALFIPFAPWRIETLPAAMLQMSIGIVKGEHFVGPLSMIEMCCFSKVSKPPAPEPIMTPTL